MVTRSAGRRTERAERQRMNAELNAYNGPFIIETVTVVETHKRDGTQYYTFEVFRSDGKPSWQMDLRYSDLAEAKARMETRGGDLGLGLVHQFPPKDINNKNCHLQSLADGAVKLRRNKLEAWVMERIHLVKRGKSDKQWVQKYNLRSKLHRIEQNLNVLFGVRFHYNYIGSSSAVGAGNLETYEHYGKDIPTAVPLAPSAPYPPPPTDMQDTVNTSGSGTNLSSSKKQTAPASAPTSISAALVAGEAHRSSLTENDLASIDRLTHWFELNVEVRNKKARAWATKVVCELDFTSVEKLARRLHTPQLLQEEMGLSAEDAQDLSHALSSMKDGKPAAMTS